MFQTRYLFAVVSLISVYAAEAQTSSVKLAWNPSAGPQLAGYRIYDGVSSHTYTNIVQVGNVTNATISGLTVGVTYFFSVTAYDTSGLESPFSNEISYKVTNSTLPTISLTVPTSGATFAAPAVINCAASVAANGHTITKVQFYNSATLLAEVTASPYNFAWNSVSAGTYSLSAKAVYDTGSVVASAPITVTVTNPPSGNTTNLVGDWTFDAVNVSGTTVLDSSATGNSGTLTGTPLPTIMPGKLGQAVSLTNLSQLVNVPDSASLNITGPFTVAAWVNFSALPGAGRYPSIVAKLYDLSGHDYGYGLIWNGTGVIGMIGTGGAAWTQTSAYTPAVGVWNHYASVFDGVNLKLYVNGVLYSQVAAAAPGSTATIPVKMGPHYSNPTTYGFVNGLFDDARIYKGALDATTISQLYNNGGSGCTYTLSPVSNSFSASGGTGSVTVTAGSGCTWSASSTVPWITVTSGASGTGSGTVNYAVQANTGTGTRTGTLTIAGKSFTVTQGGTACSYVLSPASASFGAAGGNGSASVTATGGCVWMATSGVSWTTINSGSSGTGNGAVTYTVAPNTSATSRNGTLTIAGQSFTILQAAAPLDTTPPSVTLTAPASGTTVRGTISLTATASDNLGVTKVEFYCDGTVLEGTSLAPPYTSWCDTTRLANGTHSFRAKAYDAAGNWATSANSIVTVKNHK